MMDAKQKIAIRQLIDFFNADGSEAELSNPLVQQLCDAMKAYMGKSVGLGPTGSVQDNPETLFYIKNQNLEYIYGNENFLALMEGATRNPQGLTDQDLFSPEAAAEIQAMDRDLLANPRTISLETSRKLNGHHFNLETTKSVFRDVDGHPVGIIGVSRDITQEKTDQENKEIIRRKFELFFNQSIDAYCIFRIEEGKPHALLEFNDATCSLLAYSREELEVLSPAEIFPLEAVMMGGAERPLDQENWYPFRRTRLYKKGGEPVNVDLGFQLTSLGQEQIMLVILRDMTEYEQAYGSVRKSEGRLKALFNAIPDLVVHINRAGQILGQKPGSGRRGSGNSDLFRDSRAIRSLSQIWELLPEETHAEAKELIGRVLEEQVNEIFEFQTKGILGGERIRDFEARICPIDTEEIVVFVREITDRKRRGEAIAQSEERLRLLYNSNPMMIINFDFDQRILSVNQSTREALGYQEGELVDQFRESLIHEGDRGLAETRFFEYLEGENESNGCEYRILDQEGNSFWVEERARVTTDLEGRGTVVVSCRDITRRRKAEQEIMKSLKEKEILLREVHHRVKNNLQIINSVLSLQMGQYLDPVIHQALKESQNRILAMSLIHENLYRSEGISNLHSLEYFRELCGHLFRAYNISTRQIEVDYQVENINLELAHGIPLGLITNELVTNVIKYAFSENNGEGKVLIVLRENGEDIHFSFSDNGVGLPEGFDPGASKSMGFRLIQILSRQLRGNFGFHSNSGLTFELTFPKQELE